MVVFPNTPDRKGVEAVVHFFLGLMKADGGISVDEVNEVKILLYKFRHNLPGEYETNFELLEKLKGEPSVSSWDHYKHLDHGLACWEEFRASRGAKPNILDSIFMIIEILSEIDEITNEEKVFMEKMANEFSKRFGVEVA